jgi:3-hydroxyacyl-CoA dehydrogenase
MSTLTNLPLAQRAEATGIRRAAAIGAGSMGSGIAAQVANAGIPVDLLEIPAATRSRSAPAMAVSTASSRSAVLYLEDTARIVRLGNAARHALVEIVSEPDNDPAVVVRARAACETLLGKTPIDCRDTPGFIANRIGCHWLAVPSSRRTHGRDDRGSGRSDGSLRHASNRRFRTA